MTLNKKTMNTVKVLKRWITMLAICLTGLAALAQDQNEIEIARTYFLGQEYEKAKEAFDQLAKRSANTKLIHKEYLETLIALKELKAAEKHVKKAIKAYPDEMRYVVDYAYLMDLQGDKSQAQNYLSEATNEQKNNIAALRYLSVHMVTYRFYDQAEKTLLTARKIGADRFDIELAELYQIWGKTDQMVTKYLDLLEYDGEKQPFVQGQLSAYLSEEQFETLEEKLISYAQKNSSQITFNEMLVWYYLQQGDYYMAFTQCKTVDRRTGANGLEVLRIGQMALDNEEYKTATKIFDYIIQKYEKTSAYQRARTLVIKAREAIIKAEYPVDKALIYSLVSDYESVINDLGINPYTADAIQNLALLEAFYLDNRDNAKKALENLIESPRMPRKTISETKLVLGDIYLLDGEPWEASLIYSQVEKAEKETETAHDAKLRNAKMSYYVGDFDLAKGHLDVLKMATSREIANDAMNLSLLIQDNLELDTNETAMRLYAATDLLVFQNKINQALTAYDSMIVQYKGHTLMDEILWQKAQLLLKLGRHKEAANQLEIILKDHLYDIVADNANFMLGEIYERYLDDKEKAMEYYQAQFTKPEFDGSLYIVEARKRYRRLRGDKL